jgi:hypothetical protein
MAELAVPFRAHDHPARATQGQGDRPLHAAGARLTDGARRARLGRCHPTPAQVEASRSGRCGRSVRRAAVRGRGGRGQDEQRKEPKRQQSQSAPVPFCSPICAWGSNLPGQRRPASVSGSVSVCDQRPA